MNTLEARRRLLGGNVYKRTTEGNPAIAQGSLARMYPGITMQGWTEQAQYEGKNLFNLVDLLSLIPENGSNLVNVVLNVTGLKPNTAYTLSSTIDGDLGGIYTNRCLYIGDTDGSNAVFVGHPVSKSSGDGGEITVYFYPFRDISQGIKSGSGNVQLEEGTVVTTYEPYTGGQPSPSPDYPQEIVSAGKYNEETGKWEYEVKLTGANLFDLRTDNIVLFRGAGTKQDIDNGVRLSYENVRDIAYTVDFTFKIGKTYFVSFDINVVSDILDGSVSLEYIPICVTSNDKPSWWAKDVFEIRYKIGTSHYEGMFTPEKECTMYISGNNGTGTGTGYTDITNFILTEVENAEYEPYHTPQTVNLTSDRPLTKWDKLEKRSGQWGWAYKSEEIESYTDESVPGEYFSTTGRLSTGAQVWYETTTETFVPLSESEQEAMNALYTFRPTTVLSNDCECNMSLTYKTKKSMWVRSNPYGIEFGGISGSGDAGEFDAMNRIRTGYIPFYSPDGSRTFIIVGSKYVVTTLNAYDKQRNVRGAFSSNKPPKGTWFVRISFSKPDNSDFTKEELGQLIRTFDIERS